MIQSSLPKVASSINIESARKPDDLIPRTSHSFSSIESAFDSNQSVAGSSVEILSESSSQISHASQTSQSSIEVIDNSRKPSEERKISQAPSLDTIDDDSAKQDSEQLTIMKKSTDLDKVKSALSIGNVNLTESSSSGSVCESVCTAYEQNGKKHHKESTKTPLDGIFKASSMLLSKTKSRKDSETEASILPSAPIQYNYEDFSIFDHRVKLFLFQNVLEDNDEKLMWIVKCLLIEDGANLTASPVMPTQALVVMSTRKLYILKITGEESDDIEKWLKVSISSSVNKIVIIRELPLKFGFSFVLLMEKIGITNVHLLLQDRNVMDRLRKHITTSSKC